MADAHALFAVQRETLDFLRGTTCAEYAAGGLLHEHADQDLLRRLSTPAVSRATVDALADSIRNRVVRNSALVSHVGHTGERDALPPAADYLSHLEGIETAIVFGIVDDDSHISSRSTDARVHFGDVLSETFGDAGSAGGLREMAGGRGPARRPR
jgi:nanoRNase/pAp phosphatase (c-di-AMP/oligoRNAs hydrolase)